MKADQLQELRRKIGDLNAHCGIEDVNYNGGPAGGTRALQLNNGRGTRMTVLADRGLDIPSLEFKGHQLAFTSKTGIRSPALYMEDGARGFLRQFQAGFLTTCGLSYAGSPYTQDGQAHGLHGPFSNTPASRVNAWMDEAEGEVLIRLAGEVAQTQVFGEHLVLTRTLTLHTEQNSFVIHDTVQNRGFIKSSLMLLYHINFGYPLLNAGSKVYSSARDILPRDENAKKGFERWGLMEEPGADRPEECFFHLNPPGPAFAVLHNEALGIAAAITYDATHLPLLCEWKCMREGDYALGLEPTTSGVLSRAEARENGSLQFLEPGESREFQIRVDLLDKQADISRYTR